MDVDVGNVPTTRVAVAQPSARERHEKSGGVTLAEGVFDGVRERVGVRVKDAVRVDAADGGADSDGGADASGETDAEGTGSDWCGECDVDGDGDALGAQEDDA